MTQPPTTPGSAQPAMTKIIRHEIIVAAELMDWGQIVMHRGPACFRLEKDGRFCGRAHRWGGHTDAYCHEFVSLADLLRSFSP